MTGRECDSCTCCCDGSLPGEAFGAPFYQGSPCVAVHLGRGCTRYDERPPVCREFRCVWLDDESLPGWMKPDSCNAVVVARRVGTIRYAELVENAYRRTDTATVIEFTQWALPRYGNVKFSINGGWKALGSPGFLAAMQRPTTA